MLHYARRSLLGQLLSVYLLFVIVVLLGGVAVPALVEQKLTKDAQASEQALAPEIAIQTHLPTEKRRILASSTQQSSGTEPNDCSD